jgi:hypothetical protein
MARTRFALCKYCGDLHQYGKWPDNCKIDPPARSDYPSPYVVSDSLPGGVNGLFHHGTAKRTDSKSGFRKMTKEAGCIEVGNEYAPTASRPYRDNVKTEAIESAVNEALHQQGVSSESDVGDFIV